MKIKLTGRHRSLKDFEFDFDKGLTIITGYNGAGKSQLLWLINMIVGQTIHSDNSIVKYPPNDPEYLVELENFKINEYGANLLWRSNEGGSVFNQKILYRDFKEVCLELFCILNPDKTEHVFRSENRNMDDANWNGKTSIISNDLLRTFVVPIADELINEIITKSKKSKEELDIEDIYAFFPVEMVISELQPHQGDQMMSFYFYAYQIKAAFNKKYNKNHELSETPWSVLQSIIDSLGFKYKVIPPKLSTINKILSFPLNAISEDPYQIILYDEVFNKEINFHELSSGEKQLFAIGMLRYSTELGNNRRKLILLDEPDAHLHPSMIEQFFTIVNDYLVKANGVKVIMTTHSATTLLLASNYSNLDLYFMNRSSEFENTSLIKDESYRFSKSIKSLSNGLFFLHPQTQFVVVEDQDDVDFYNAISEFSRKECSVLNFIAASELSDNGEGGKDAVQRIIERLKKYNVLTIGESPVIGLIDKDYDNVVYEENDSIVLIERYSIENYWYDPLIIYCILLSGSKDEQFEKIDTLKLKPGEEHNIRSKRNDEIQNQVNNLVVELEKRVDFQDILSFEFLNQDKILKSPNSEKEHIDIEYLNGHNVSLPKWLINSRGKDLRQLYQATFPSLYKMNKAASYKNFRSTGHVPIELISKIESFLSN